jgi:hypothetical protein
MPAAPSAPVDLGTCPVHGTVEVRRHNVGRSRSGAQRIAWRCLACHAENQTAINHGRRRPHPTSIGFCKAEADVNGVTVPCRRPFEHPADVHVDAEGRMWPARTDRGA